MGINYSPPIDAAVIFYALPGTHVHYTYLTHGESSQLMLGSVASVVKESSSESTGTAHTHTVTITWDSTNFTFIVSFATSLSHTHDTAEPQSTSGWQTLGKTMLTGAAASTSIITIPARHLLRITCVVTGYSGNGIASLRFGGTAGAVDSGNNYNTRYLRAASGSNNSFTDAPTTTTNMMRLGSQAITLGRSVTVSMTNFTSIRKMGAILTSSEAGAVGTAPSLDWGQGMWANTTQQIISVQMVATANNLNNGSGFVVEGMNIG
jgi:hypothetical protein